MSVHPSRQSDGRPPAFGDASSPRSHRGGHTALGELNPLPVQAELGTKVRCWPAKAPIALAGGQHVRSSVRLLAMRRITHEWPIACDHEDLAKTPKESHRLFITIS